MVKVVKSAAEFQQALKFVGLTVVDFTLLGVVHVK